MNVQQEPSLRQLRREVATRREEYLAALRAYHRPPLGPHWTAESQTAATLYDLNHYVEQGLQIQIARMAYEEARDRLTGRESMQIQGSIRHATWVMAALTLVIAAGTAVAAYRMH